MTPQSPLLDCKLFERDQNNRNPNTEVVTEQFRGTMLIRPANGKACRTTKAFLQKRRGKIAKCLWWVRTDHTQAFRRKVSSLIGLLHRVGRQRFSKHLPSTWVINRKMCIFSNTAGRTIKSRVVQTCLSMVCLMPVRSRRLGSSLCWHTRVGTLIVATIYLQLIQNT